MTNATKMLLVDSKPTPSTPASLTARAAVISDRFGVPARPPDRSDLRTG